MKLALTFQESWRRVVAAAVLLDIPTPALSSALAFYTGYTSEVLPANIIQVTGFSLASLRSKVYIDSFASFWWYPVVRRFA